MVREDKKEWAIDQLRCKADELGRVPTKADFDGPTKARIKSFLGPWHRALEAAGLRPGREKDHE